MLRDAFTKKSVGVPVSPARPGKKTLGDQLPVRGIFDLGRRRPEGASLVQRVEDDVAPPAVEVSFDELTRGVINDDRLRRFSLSDLYEKVMDDLALAGAGVTQQ